MTLIEAIKDRRSVRKFEDKPVTREEIERVIELAAYAPSWKNSQTTRYTVIEDRATLDKIADEACMGFAFNSKTIKAAPMLVAVKTIDKRSGYERDGSASTSKGDHWQSYDAGIASQTFCLAAHGEGLGSVIMGIYDEAMVKSILGIDDSMSVSGLIVVGHPAEEPTMPPRKTVADLVEYK